MVFAQIHIESGCYRNIPEESRVTQPVIMELEDIEILHVIHNDVAQALVQMDKRPKEDILQNIVEKGITNEELTQVTKTLFDEAVSTYEECIEMAGTLNGSGVSNLTFKDKKRKSRRMTSKECYN